MDIVKLPDAIQESKQRPQSAIKNTGLIIPASALWSTWLLRPGARLADFSRQFSTYRRD
jgi:hypothetical protein